MINVLQETRLNFSENVPVWKNDSSIKHVKRLENSAFHFYMLLPVENLPQTLTLTDSSARDPLTPAAQPPAFPNAHILHLRRSTCHLEPFLL